ncbi:cation transporter [Flavobacterium ponti]|uniref:Cation transporter n=1 Tax=Flavobacterium ponti TaxID=665133 RepID=A0ABV9P5I5_9FLAO
MNIVKQTLLIASISLLLVSCKNENNSSSEEIQAIEQDTTKTIVANSKTASFEIEGITCAEGCANLIEGKLNKLDGVSEAKVDFDAKTATVIYDADKVNQEKITKTVEGIAGGKLYKVSKLKS